MTLAQWLGSGEVCTRKLRYETRMKISKRLLRMIHLDQVPAVRFQRLVLRCSIGLFLAASSLAAQNAKPKEYELKAVYLFNFARLAAWPDTAESSKRDSFAICVLGEDPFGSFLDAVISGEHIGGRAVVARRISDPRDAAACHVLYVSSSEEKRLKQILMALNKARVLTVSDMPEFSQRGGMIQFVTEDNKVRFEVNLRNTSDSGLTLSSELLKVAVAVINSPPPGD